MEKRRMCPHCRAFITTSDRVCPYCDTPVGARAVDRAPGQILGGFIPHAQFVTTSILLINFGLFAACVLASMQSGQGGQAFMSIDGGTLFDFGAKLREAIRMGQWWRLVTAGFLHGGILHILMNSWVLFDLGAQVEELYGSARFIVIYFLSSVFGFYLSALWYPGLSVGASAGLLGLIGAMIALSLHHPLGRAFRAFYVRWLIYGLLIGLLPGLHIDMAAHVGGLVAGFIAAYVAGMPKPFRTTAEYAWRVAAGLCLGMTVLAFLRWFLWFSRSAGQ